MYEYMQERSITTKLCRIKIGDLISAGSYWTMTAPDFNHVAILMAM